MKDQRQSPVLSSQVSNLYRSILSLIGRENITGQYSDILVLLLLNPVVDKVSFLGTKRK